MKKLEASGRRAAPTRMPMEAALNLLRPAVTLSPVA
jgi:hypothetical protein